MREYFFNRDKYLNICIVWSVILIYRYKYVDDYIYIVGNVN